jgi:antitoxin MazE
MARAKVGKWGKNLAIRVPHEIAEALGLSDGEQVELHAKDGNLAVIRPEARKRAEAEKAAEAILKRGRGMSLRGLSIKDLINEGRK